MSEQLPNSAGRLDNWDGNKIAHEKQEWEDSLYGEAGKSDFSDEARSRVEEADAYEQHMASVADNADHEPMDADQLDAIDRTIAGDPALRRMANKAQEIADLASHKLDETDDAERMTDNLKEQEDKLEELLLEYQESGAAHDAEKDEIFNRIINMSRVSEGEKSEPTNDTLDADTSWTGKESAGTYPTDKLDIDTSWADKDTKAEKYNEGETDTLDIDTGWADGVAGSYPEADKLEIDTSWADEKDSDKVNIDTTWADDVEKEPTKDDTLGIDTSWADKEDGDVKKPRTKRERMKDALLHPGAYLGARMVRNVNEKESNNEKGEKSKRRKIMLGVAALTAVGVAAYLAKDGFEFPGFGDSGPNAQNTGGTDPSQVTEVPSASSTTSPEAPTGGSPDTGGDWNFSDGSGGEALMNNNGIDASVWYEHQDEFAEKFPELTYRMSDGNIGLIDQSASSNASNMPEAAQEFWQQYK